MARIFTDWQPRRVGACFQPFLQGDNRNFIDFASKFTSNTNTISGLMCQLMRAWDAVL